MLMRLPRQSSCGARAMRYARDCVAVSLPKFDDHFARRRRKVWACGIKREPCSNHAAREGFLCDPAALSLLRLRRFLLSDRGRGRGSHVINLPSAGENVLRQAEGPEEQTTHDAAVHDVDDLERHRGDGGKADEAASGLVFVLQARTGIMSRCSAPSIF